MKANVLRGEKLSLDLEEMLATGALVIEWPERIESILPKKRLWINLEYIAEEQRRLQFAAQGAYYQNMIEKIRKSAFGVN